jgi:hypothetical protein
MMSSPSGQRGTATLETFNGVAFDAVSANIPSGVKLKHQVSGPPLGIGPAREIHKIL